ncbi:jacalin-related lectin 19-like isoform X2 [Benincasa hispida]|uniref:jacalin-related lectin 19-like isoform X2 n=1 Tax=Benincasa hispida TaxID=102211 RepID=UPI001902AEED|nr:jacalin-related lectin 19-like isoform X2 [Benincasa hispida]
MGRWSLLIYKTNKHGGTSNYGTLNKVVLEYPNEYLVSIHGYMGDEGGYDEHYVIRSLTFESNKRSFGPFGQNYGIPFWFPTSGLVKVVGFHGKAGWFLDSIGIKVVPVHNNTIISSVE